MVGPLAHGLVVTGGSSGQHAVFGQQWSAPMLSWKKQSVRATLVAVLRQGPVCRLGALRVVLLPPEGGVSTKPTFSGEAACQVLCLRVSGRGVEGV